jgi:hypothetical protein
MGRLGIPVGGGVIGSGSGSGLGLGDRDRVGILYRSFLL